MSIYISPPPLCIQLSCLVQMFLSCLVYNTICCLVNEIRTKLTNGSEIVEHGGHRRSEVVRGAPAELLQMLLLPVETYFRYFRSVGAWVSGLAAAGPGKSLFRRCHGHVHLSAVTIYLQIQVTALYIHTDSTT